MDHSLTSLPNTWGLFDSLSVAALLGEHSDLFLYLAFSFRNFIGV